ncbi:hypothetical protein Tco_1522661 [Tanacetum coccineum]
MDDPNVTMEEYIRLKEEEARKCGKVFNWETTKYGKIWYNEDIHDLRYQGIEYTDADIVDFEERLERIHDRDTHRVQVVDFQGMPELMRDVLDARMLMEHNDDGGVVVFTSRARRRLFDIRGPLVGELILEFLSTLKFGELLLDLDAPGTIQFQLGGSRRRMSWRQFIVALGLHTGEEMESLGFARYWSESERMIPWKGDLRDYWRSISTNGDFLGPLPSYTLIRDTVLRLFHRMMAHSIAGRSQAPEKVTVTDLFYLRGLNVGSVNIPYLLAKYLKRFAAGRKSEALISSRKFVSRLAEHFGLLTEERLQGLTVALGPERQPDAAAGAPRAIEDAHVVDEGDQTIPAPVQAPQQPPSPPPTTGKTMPQRLGRLEEEVQGLRQDVRTLRGLVERLMTNQGRFSTWMISCMTQLMEASGQTYQAFDGTFRGSSHAAF